MNSGRVVKPQCRVQNCRGPFWEVRFTNLCLACPPIFLATETETHPYPLGLLQPHLALGLNQYYITKILKESCQPCVGWQNWPWVWILTEKAVAPHPSTLAWKIPWTEETGRLQSMGLRRVRRDWATSFSLFTFMDWRRQWQSTPVLLLGKSHGWRSLVGCSPWGRKESDTTERLHFHFSLSCIGEGNGNPL